MGAVFFAGLLVILYALAGTFCLLGTILLIISIVKKRRERKFKAWRVFAIISYCIAFVFIMIPVGWFGFLRIANQQTFEGYVDTGVYVTHDSYNVNAGDQFYFNDDLYIKVDNELQGFQVEFGQAVANAKGSENSLLSKIFNYNDEETMYEVKNDSGYTILATGNKGTSRLFYRQEDSENIRKFYDSLKTYKYYYGEFGSDDGLEYVEMNFDEETFNKLLDENNKGETASAKHDESTEYTIIQTSPDGVLLCSAYIVMTKDEAFITSSSSGGTSYGDLLDDETTAIVKSAVGYKPN